MFINFLLACSTEKIEVSEVTFKVSSEIFNGYNIRLNNKGYVNELENFDKCQGNPYYLEVDGIRLRFAPKYYPGLNFRGIILQETKEISDQTIANVAFTDRDANGLAEEYFVHRSNSPALRIHEIPLSLYVSGQDPFSESILEFQKQYAKDLETIFSSSKYTLYCY